VGVAANEWLRRVPFVGDTRDPLVVTFLCVLAIAGLVGLGTSSEDVVKGVGGALLLVTAYFTAGSRRDTRASQHLDQLMAISKHLCSDDPVVRCAAEQVLSRLEDDEESSTAAKAVRAAAHDARPPSI
jgi:hypothetical protein